MRSKTTKLQLKNCPAHECVYLKAYDTVSQARADIARYIDWYNQERGHSSHEGKTPDEVYLAGLPKLQEAA